MGLLAWGSHRHCHHAAQISHSSTGQGCAAAETRAAPGLRVEHELSARLCSRSSRSWPQKQASQPTADRALGSGLGGACRCRSFIVAPERPTPVQSVEGIVLLQHLRHQQLHRKGSSGVLVQLAGRGLHRKHASLARQVLAVV